MLDAIQLRVLGVLVEKEHTVPDSYPLTENSLLSGCNQKSNREPVMDVTPAELNAALLALRDDGFVVRTDSSVRAARYRHRAEDRLNVSPEQLAVLTELMLRGAQAPGALDRRVERMGVRADPDGVRDLLEQLAAHQPQPLVERLPRASRERDNRWRHLLIPGEVYVPPPDLDGTDDDRSAADSPAPRRSVATSSALAPGLSDRLAALEREVAELRTIVDGLRGG